jgi:hypothetical protein
MIEHAALLRLLRYDLLLMRSCVGVMENTPHSVSKIVIALSLFLSPMRILLRV